MPVIETLPYNPLSPYAASKVAGELYCNVSREIYGLPTISLRYFNVFGPRQDPDSQYSAVIPKFINAILHGISPVIYGDGKQSRDFTHVKHVVMANILACESDAVGVYNIACGHGITINYLAETINEFLGRNIKPVYEKPVAGDIRHSVADISRAKMLGFDPAGDFKEELRETVEWFNSCCSGPVPAKESTPAHE